MVSMIGEYVTLFSDFLSWCFLFLHFNFFSFCFFTSFLLFISSLPYNFPLAFHSFIYSFLFSLLLLFKFFFLLAFSLWSHAVLQCLWEPVFFLSLFMPLMPVCGTISTFTKLSGKRPALTSGWLDVDKSSFTAGTSGDNETAETVSFKRCQV